MQTVEALENGILAPQEMESGFLAQKCEMVKEMQRAQHKLVFDGNEERPKEEGREKKVKDAPKQGKPLGSLGQSWLSVGAQIKESRWRRQHQKGGSSLEERTELK